MVTRRSAGKRGSGRPKLDSPVHDRIAALRKERGLTQLELADEIEVHSTAVSHWENGGRPDTTILPSLARALGTTVEELIEGDTKYEALREAFAS